ncbi:ABC transporter permease [Frankia sp. CNm7]|uniref:ABC transporter permease n=1 Tax=Frankia nepalensis TaxID=1836974 RepID=A0A937RMM0_9ACTN|nr:ABC transporter permease [Frankia nepalensis]MBL7502663.1 ABC transporter permease [Frankia nepalensis]MBL7514927.1 ABC transporter permease [Frankia nepalensis]MBL7522080.1 ABC transporter permease [Frankia nepalensis]MBL7632887.1 ABC transporter permease [Frankia nepalensis]
MSRLVRGELIKVLSTRTALAFTAASVGLTAANVVVVALASGTLDEVGEKEEALSGMPILLLLLGAVGAAGEFRHRTAAPAALASGASRERLLLARAVAYAIAGLVAGTLMVGVSLGAGLPLLARQPGPDLGAGEIAGVAGGLLASSVLATVIGVAVGALVRDQILAAVGALVLTFVVNPLIDLLREGASDYTPLGAVAVLTRMAHGTGRVSLTAAAVVLAAWAAGLLAAAVAGERRRDLA